MKMEQSSNLNEYLVESKFDIDPDIAMENWLNMQAEVGIIVPYITKFEAIQTVLVALSDQQLNQIKLIDSVGDVRPNRTHKV